MNSATCWRCNDRDRLVRREIGLCDGCIEYLRAEITPPLPRRVVEETPTPAMLERIGAV